METPSSTRRVTRSQQTLLASNCYNVSRKTEESEMNTSKSKQIIGQQQDRSALIDITNDSPIAGLATGSNLGTPLSSMGKKRGSRMKKTPGSGEALLRGQVKTLLMKVEEEGEVPKLSLENRPFLQILNSSPMGLLAPTPANTPQILSLSGNSTDCLASVAPSTIVQEQLIPLVVNHLFDGKKKENSELEKNLITRSLLHDFSEKSEISDGLEDCSSDASIWSIQVNASRHDEDEEEEIVEDDEEHFYEDDEYDDDDDDDDGGVLLDELCEGLNNISVDEERIAPKFSGKHTRFVYNSDDELVKEEEEEQHSTSSPNVLRLKGMPTPKGKHLRFFEDENVV